MIRAATVLAAAFFAATAAAAQPAPVTTVLKTLDATSAGQPIVMPAGPLRVTLSETTIAAHGVLPPHKHPYPRYVFVTAGRLRVTNLVTGQVSELKTGDTTIDPIGQWHEAVALGDDAVHLITIDQAPPGAPASVRRDP
jgi:quercetin dioxygenase-like cupin family protein